MRAVGVLDHRVALSPERVPWLLHASVSGLHDRFVDGVDLRGRVAQKGEAHALAARLFPVRRELLVERLSVERDAIAVLRRHFDVVRALGIGKVEAEQAIEARGALEVDGDDADHVRDDWHGVFLSRSEDVARAVAERLGRIGRVAIRLESAAVCDDALSSAARLRRDESGRRMSLHVVARRTPRGKQRVERSSRGRANTRARPPWAPQGARFDEALTRRRAKLCAVHSLFDELVSPRTVVDSALSPIEQVRAAAARQLRAVVIDAIPAPLWRSLCAEGTFALDELLSLFDREDHPAALRELVPLLSGEKLLELASCGDDRVIYECVLRLASLGAHREAIERALAVASLADDVHVMLSVCELVAPSLRSPLVERAMALAAKQSHSGLTKELCAMVRLVEEPASRDALLALCEERVARTLPEQMDVGENAWGWLALAYARLDRPEQSLPLIDRAIAAVRAKECDPLSDAYFALECARALDANERREERVALARRALESMREHPNDVSRWWVDSLAAIDPASEGEARAMLRPESDPPPPSSQEPIALAPLEEARECAADGRSEWKVATLSAIREALEDTLRTREEPEIPSQDDHVLERARDLARATYARWMNSAFDHRSKGWITTVDGESLSYERQWSVVGHLSLEEIEALLAHACPDRARRRDLLYLVAQAARGHARLGNVRAMRSHVETIANFSTTPTLEFDLVELLPEPLREPELRRVFASALSEEGRCILDRRRLSTLMTDAALDHGEQRSIVLQIIEQIEPTTLALECLGRLLRVGDLPRDDDERCCAMVRAIAPRAFGDDLSEIALTEDLTSAIRALDDGDARRLWVRFANADPPKLSWPFTVRVFGEAAVAQFEEELRSDAL